MRFPCLRCRTSSNRRHGSSIAAVVGAVVVADDDDADDDDADDDGPQLAPHKPLLSATPRTMATWTRIIADSTIDASA